MPEGIEPREIGQRMKAAAKAKGLNAYVIADALGVRPPTVYRWWAGTFLPGRKTMAAYADLVEKPLQAFYGEEAAAEAIDLLLGIVNRVMEGEEAEQAVEVVLGGSSALTDGQRAELREVAPYLKERLARILGDDWTLIPPVRRRAALEELRQQIEDDAPDSAESPEG